MVGARPEHEELRYPVEDVARKHDAGVETETVRSGNEAYARVRPARRQGPTAKGPSRASQLEFEAEPPTRATRAPQRTAFVIGSREPNVLVDRVHLPVRALAVGGGVHLADEPVFVEHGQREVAPAPLRLRLVHLERVLEVEQLLRPRAVVDQPVERRQQRRPPFEATVDLRRGRPATRPWMPSTVGARRRRRRRPARAA